MESHRPTVRDAQTEATRALRAAGIENPAGDARILLEAATGAKRTDLLAEPDRVLSPQAAERLGSMLNRRLRREPVSRILGKRAFRGREFSISPATLDPRPDTETLVEAVLKIVTREGWRDKPIRILDFGTGSGCILVTLLAELPNAAGCGVDIDANALEIAARNAGAHGVAGRLVLSRCESIGELDGPFDLVVSNPPYIPTCDIEGLEPEVRLFEPRQALDGGLDGLDFHRAIVAAAVRLAPKGWVAVEVGNDQAARVVEMVETGGQARTDTPETWPDLTGIQRCVAWKTR